MADFDYDIGIIGGGAAGLTVAAGASQLGAKTLLVEKQKELGGDCLHFGCVPSKTLIKSAKVYHMLRHAERYGLPAVEVPPVDFRQVSGRIRAVIGVQILGPNAGDLVAEWVAVLNGKMKLATLAAAVHPYPTVAEINKRVAGNFFSEKIFSDKVRKGLKLIFQLKGRACALPG